jgi:glutamate dehydrogenase (NADP+)
VTTISPALQPHFDIVLSRNPGEVEFHQAVAEVLGSLGPVVERHPEYVDHASSSACASRSAS